MTHDLKSWPGPFLAILSGEKTHEFRRDDRHFQVGDTLRLREWTPEGYPTLVPPTFTAHYTGRETTVRVTYVTRGPDFGVPPGYAVLSIAVPQPQDEAGDNDGTCWVCPTCGTRVAGPRFAPDCPHCKRRFMEREAERSGTQQEERASEARTLGDAPENRPESAGVAQKGATGVSPRIEAPASPAQTPPSEGVREALELLQRAKERIIKHVAGWPGVHDPTLLQDIDDFTRAALAAPSREGLGEPDRPPPFGI